MSSQSDAFPDVVEIVVEIPRGSRNKYEFDEITGVFRLDRVLASAVHYNFERPHRGYRTRGRTPGSIFFSKRPEILQQMGACDDDRHAA